MESQQEIKNLLKLAKETIKNKQFRETLKLCKSVIDKEKDNYNAWLFTGLAAEELNSYQQALAAYQKAIQLAPNQPTAWQGLAQFYEKQNSFSELVSVYSELRKLFSNDQNKHYEYSMRLANVLIKQGKPVQCAQIYHSLLKINNKEKNPLVIDSLVNILIESSEVLDSCVYTDLFSFLNETSDVRVESDKMEKLHEKYLEAIIKEKYDWKDIENECSFILEKLSNGNQLSIQTLFKIFSQILISDDRDDQLYDQTLNNFKNLLEKTQANDSYNYYHLFYKMISFEYINNENLSMFKEYLDKICTTEPSRVTTTYLANKYYAFINDSANVIKTSFEGISQLDVDLLVKQVRPSIKTRFIFNQGLALLSQQKYVEAINVINKMSQTKNKDLVLLSKRFTIEAYLALNQKEKAEKLFLDWFSSENDSSIKTIIFILLKIYDNDLEFAFKMAKTLDINTYEGNFIVAKIAYLILVKNKQDLFLNENINDVFMSSILKSIRMNPFQYQPIQLFGNFYKNIIKDSKKALKCYQKTYELCKDLNICGLELVDCLLSENMHDLATNILRKAIDEIPYCKWAQLRLGLLNLKNGNHNEAIRLFYAVIRYNAEDFNTWECLAEAYLNRGSFTAALKSFKKALDINPQSNYAKYQVAFIKQSLKMNEEAIVDYLNVLESIPNHIPTLKGLGETYFQLSVDNIQNLTDNKFLEYIEKCIEYVYQGLQIRKDLCCFWKLLGDSSSQVYFFPELKDIIKVPSGLFELCDLKNEQSISLNKSQLLKLAEKSYMMCCKLKPNYGSYWYDLGLIYYRQSKLDQSSKDMFKALNCLLQAIKLDQDNYLNWNLLGIIYATREISKPALAQHSFIKSIQLESSSPLNWTNLGVFYLTNHNLKLANECFKKSQAIDPEFCVAWIGQAFIAETVDAEQSIDLYRHAVELINHTEAQYGYGRIVSILSSDKDFKKTDNYKEYIDYMDAIPIASDCLVKYLTRVKSNYNAFLMCGILFEKQKLFNFALDYYQCLLDCPVSDLVEIGRRCYARVLGHLNRFEEALIEYKKIDYKATIEDTFALAKIFYKVGKYQQAFMIYENGLKISVDNDKSIVYTALGMASAKFNMNDAITNFLKSFQSKPICMQSLFALCSIGFLKNDAKLIAAVFKELDEITDYAHRFEILKLKTIYYSLKKEYRKAISFISKYVHENPKESKGWIELCLCLRRSQMYDLALTLGKKVLNLGLETNTIFYECFQNILLNQIEKVEDPVDLLRQYQKTIHLYPASKNTWIFFQAFLKLSNEEKFQETIKSLQVLVSS